MDKAREIKNRLTIDEVIQAYGLNQHMNGKYKCPFHNDHSPSLSTKNGKYKCFVCDAGGDVIDFVKSLYGISFQDAIKKLDNDFNLGLSQSLSKEEIYRINQKRKKVEQLKAYREEVNAKYMSTYDKLCSDLKLCNSIKNNSRMKSWDEIDENYIKAINRIPILEYMISEMDKAW